MRFPFKLPFGGLTELFFLLLLVVLVDQAVLSKPEWQPHSLAATSKK